MKKDRREILLPTEDIISRGLQDLYLDIDLQREFEIIKKDKLDNDFNLAQQFRKERNASRNFFLYGVVDSNVVDTNSIVVELYWSSNTTSPYFISSATTSPLVYNQVNVFGKKRGRYFFELPNFNGSQERNSVYIFIKSDGVNFLDQVVEKQLIFYDAEGSFIEYGTETVDFGEDFESISISNNFPFFYNKHWVKQDVNIIQVKPPIAGFESPVYTISEGQSADIAISLNKPSAFGTESLEVYVFSSATAILNSTAVSTNDYTYLGTPLSPLSNTLVSWQQGEKDKIFTINATHDFINEPTESIYYRLTNFQNLEQGLSTTVVNIQDATQRKYVQYVIPSVYQNRYPYTSTTTSSILRNGYNFSIKNEEFYAVDKYRLEIKNEGINTIFPTNNGLVTIPSEQIWPAGETRVFDITPKYNSTSYEEIKLNFLYRNYLEKAAAGGKDYVVSIDGVNYDKIGSAAELDYWLNTWESTFDKPFIHTYSNYEITIKATSKGHPLNFYLNGIGLTTSNLTISQQGMSITAKTITAFSEPTQSAERIKLCANSTDGNSCLYKFTLKKRLFRTIEIPASQVQANQIYNQVYLTSQYSEQTMNFNRDYGTFGFLDCIQKISPIPLSTGDCWINGANFLVAHKLHNTEVVDASWRSAPINTIPCTSSKLSTKDKPKIAVLRMLQGTSGQPYTWGIKVDPFYTNNFINISYQVNNGSPTGARTQVFNRMYGSTPQFRQTVAFAKNNPSPFSPQNFPRKSEVFVYIPKPNSNFVTNNTDTYYPYADPFKAVVLSGGNSQIEFKIKDPLLMTIETHQEREVVGVTINNGNNYLGGFNTTINGGLNNSAFVVPL